MRAKGGWSGLNVTWKHWDLPGGYYASILTEAPSSGEASVVAIRICEGYVEVRSRDCDDGSEYCVGRESASRVQPCGPACTDGLFDWLLHHSAGSSSV